MKYILLVALLIFSFNVQAAPQITKVRNYNIITADIATGGYIYEGGDTELKAKGFATILDLRTPPEGTAEEEKRIKKLGMKYINQPVSHYNFSNKQLDDFKNVVENSVKPLLIHCASGNRVGALWSAYQIREGIEANKAYKQGRSAGMRENVQQELQAKK